MKVMSDTSDSPIAVFRLLAAGSRANKIANPNCAAEECGRTTREGKPYCSTHVEMGIYVRGVMKELALRNKESRQLELGEDIDVSGHLVRETLLMLDQGSYTEAKFARLMDITHKAAENLIRLMADNGLAKIGRTDRGCLTIYKLDIDNEKSKKKRIGFG